MEYTGYVFKNLTEGDDDILIAMLSDSVTGFHQEGDTLTAFTSDETMTEQILKENERTDFEKIKVPEENWNRKWESSFEPVTISANNVQPFVHIRADFHPAKSDAVYELVITPKMSFGTGHHATTSLVVKHMQEVDFNGKTVMDFGTGTGVLAILASKMGATKVIAIDSDEWSVKNAAENFSVNHIENIKLVHDSKPAEEVGDIMIANINLNIIKEHLSGMHTILSDGGTIILSGMLVEDIPVIVNALSSKSFLINSLEIKNNWIMIAATKLQQQIH